MTTTRTKDKTTINSWGTTGEDRGNGANRGRKVTFITGGLTNALFKGDLPPNEYGGSSFPSDSILVLVFGAEDMLDRDNETSMFARLCDGWCTRLVQPCLNLLG